MSAALRPPSAAGGWPVFPEPAAPLTVVGAGRVGAAKARIGLLPGTVNLPADEVARAGTELLIVAVPGDPPAPLLGVLAAQCRRAAA